MRDFKINIATASSRLARRWRNKNIYWSRLVARCKETIRTSESVAEYLAMSKDKQAEVKDVGGFVGGYLQDGKRKTSCVQSRSLATLDIDFGTSEVWDDFTTQFGFAAMLYSTHKHTPDHPRYRLVFPLSREVTRDEYEPLCREIAEALGIDMFDDTTYQLARLFYWPSTSRDGEFVFKFQDGEACDVDFFLNQYCDYRDASSWPYSSREGEVVRHEIRKAEDPATKRGLIGAFCRAYSIEDAIDTFLSDVYEKTTYEGRYTYTRGTVAAGLVCYDGKFAYANNDTDPCSRQLCNAFDLCRIHLFGEADEKCRVTDDPTKLPSYAKMQELAAEDKRVRTLVAKEKLQSVKDDFAGVDLTEEDNDDAWMSGLDVDKKGNIRSTASNIILVIENDPGLKGKLWHDLFSGFDRVDGGLPWDEKSTDWQSRDDSNLRTYLENRYGLTGKDKIKDSIVSVFTSRQRHPIREYLSRLSWDGIPRLDTLLIDYLGAEDDELTRAMTRKHFTAAVARVMHPGCKYDYCLILTGPEGIGKSSLLRVLGGEWFNDSLITMEGKQGMEQARGGWIMELPELGSVKRSDVEQVKAYISRQDDVYRPAYGTVVERHPRQCVFCGTTNESYFLKGDTGNRRFWVVQTHSDPEARPLSALRADRDQVWAEAVMRWKEGENLYLDTRLERQARERQEAYNDDHDDPLREVLATFLETPVPVDWESWDLNRRRAYYRNPDPLDAVGTELRARACPAEFVCERLGRDMGDKEYKYLARKVSGLFRDLGWSGPKVSRHCATVYGIQKSFLRPEEKEEDEA